MNRNGGGNGTTVLNASLVALLACLLSGYLLRGDNAHHTHAINRSDVVHAVSGAVGSAVSNTLLYPLETIRTRLQVDTALTPRSSFVLIHRIGKDEGVRSLYRGWFSLIVALVSLNFTYFYWFHVLRRWIVDWMANKVFIDLIAGYFAGVVAVLVTGPLWLVNTRLKLQGVKIASSDPKQKQSSDKQQYTGIAHCLCKITAEEGTLTLWHGTMTSIVLSLNPAIQLGVYEALKRYHIIVGGATEGGTSTGPTEAFVNALVAKFISTVITYPIQVLQTRHRAGIRSEGGKMRLSQIYRGLESKLLQTCLNSALMFVAYERLVSLLTKYIEHGTK